MGAVIGWVAAAALAWLAIAVPFAIAIGRAIRTLDEGWDG